MKIFLFIIASLVSPGISDFSYSAYENVKDDPKKWTYFRIIANADDGEIFVKLQDDLEIEPKMEVYTIV
ncbi:MAG: hypothetical protein ACRDFC_00820, partial [Ignavibacteria bacterium]